MKIFNATSFLITIVAVSSVSTAAGGSLRRGRKPPPKPSAASSGAKTIMKLQGQKMVPPSLNAHSQMKNQGRVAPSLNSHAKKDNKGLPPSLNAHASPSSEEQKDGKVKKMMSSWADDRNIVPPAP